MPTVSFPLPHQIHITHWGWYLVVCLLLALLVRAIISTLTAWAEILRSSKPLFPGKFRKEWCAVFGGFHSQHHDLWITFFIGLIELVSYPVLIRFRQVAIIGAWLLLKTASAASWEAWKTKKTEYTRFLFGNLLTILASYWLSCFVACT